MTTPQPDDPPLTGSVCASWAQMHELPNDVQQLHTEETWCSILALATDILWAASGRQWRNVEATETVTLDPPDRVCINHAYQYRYLIPLCVNGSYPIRVRLPRPDVTAIVEVTIAGAAFTAYRRSGSWVIRTDGRGWPLTNDTRITYSFGRKVPAGGVLAAIQLATELGKALAGKPCGLPARVTSVVRQGLSFDLLESLEVLKAGLVGVYAVDQWILAVNPDKRRQSGSCWSPDIVEARPV